MTQVLCSEEMDAISKSDVAMEDMTASPKISTQLLLRLRFTCGSKREVKFEISFWFAGEDASSRQGSGCNLHDPGIHDGAHRPVTSQSSPGSRLGRQWKACWSSHEPVEELDAPNDNFSHTPGA